MAGADQKIRKPRRLTWRRVLGALALLVALALGCIAYLAAHLETPWLRARVRAAVRERLHVDIDYQRAHLGYNGFEMSGLALASMPVDRDLAPELLAIDRLTLTWHPSDLLPNHLHHLELDVAGVALHVVVDAAGVTSLERLLAALPPTPPKPPTPLSQLFAALHTAPPLRLDDLRIAGVRARVTRRLADGQKQRAYLGEIQLVGSAQTGADPQAALHVTGTHLQLELTALAVNPQLAPLLDLLPWLAPLRTGTGVLPLDLALELQLAADRLTVQSHLDAGAQQLLRLDVALDPQPDARELLVTVNHFDGLDWLALHADVRVGDALDRADVALDLAADVPALPLPGVNWRGGKLVVTGKGLHLALDPSATSVELLEVAFDTAGVTAGHAHVGAVHARAGLRVEPGVALGGDVSVTAAEINVHDAAGDVTATQAEFAVRLWNLDANGLYLTAASDLDLRARTADGRTALGGKVVSSLAFSAGDLAALRAQDWSVVRFLQGNVALTNGDAMHDGEALTWAGLRANIQLPGLVREAPLAYRLPDEASAALQLDGLRDGTGALLLEQASAAVSLSDAHVHLDAPLASTGTAHLQLTGPARIDGEISKLTDEVTWKLAVDIGFGLVDRLPQLAALRKRVDWHALQVRGHSTGHATDLTGLPHVTQDTVLHVANLTLPRRAAVRQLDLVAKSAGQGLRQVADLTLDADIARLGPVRPGGKLTATGHLDLDPETRRVALQLVAKGAKGLNASFDAQGHAQGADLAFAAVATVRNFAAFLRGLPAADRGALCLLDPDFAGKLDAKGVLTGGAAVFAHKRPPALDGQLAATLAVSALACKRPQGMANVLELDVALDATRHQGATEVDVRVTVPDLAAAAGRQALGLEDLQQHVHAELRLDGTIHLAADGQLARLSVDALAGLPLRDLTWQVRGWTGPEGARLEQFLLTNPATGTRLELHGGLDRAALRPPKVSDADVNGAVPADLPTGDGTETSEPVPGRLGLTIIGALRQDLGALTQDNAHIAARGVVNVPIRLESGDLVVFHTEARVHFDHVDFGLIKPGFQMLDIYGDIPIVEAFTLAPQFQLLGGGEDDAYSRWRYAEHQPFLRRSDFLSIAKIRYDGDELGPIAGNAGVDRDVFRMDQLEATLLHGQLTGQCMVLLSGDDTHVQLRGSATGLQVAGSDARFDANAALDFLPARRALDGRAEILHIGREHLEALLNLGDPYGEDTQSNRLRMVLKLGHPQRVRMRFSHGFMDVGVELGGLTGAVQVDELRGIALGPVFQRWLDPLLEPLRALRVREVPKP